MLLRHKSRNMYMIYGVNQRSKPPPVGRSARAKKYDQIKVLKISAKVFSQAQNKVMTEVDFFK